MGTTGKRSLVRLLPILFLCAAAAGFYYQWSDANAQGNKVVVKWLYPPIYYYDDVEMLDRGNNFSEGRVWVKEQKGEKWTLLDDSGNILKKDFEALYVDKYEEGGYARFFVDEGRLIGFLDRAGGIMLSPDNYGAGVWVGDGLISKQAENGLRGYVDMNGEWSISPIYDFVGPFREGLAAVKKGSKYGFINKSGDTVITLTSGEPFWFSHGMGILQVNGKYGVIDREGQWITEPIYEKFFGPYWSDPIGLQKDGKVGFVDSKGNVVIDFKFLQGEKYNKGSWRGLYCFKNGLATVILGESDGGKPEYGVIDESGKILLRGGDVSGILWSDFLVSANKEGGWILIDRDGKQYNFPPDFVLPHIWIMPTEDGIFTFRDAKNHKMGYFTIEK